MIDLTNKKKMPLIIVINKTNIKRAIPFTEMVCFVMIRLCDGRLGISNVIYVVLFKFKKDFENGHRSDA